MCGQRVHWSHQQIMAETEEMWPTPISEGAYLEMLILEIQADMNELMEVLEEEDDED